MTREVRLLLQEVMDENDFEYGIRERYSGRGMMGKEVEAIIVGDDNCVRQVLFLAGVKLGRGPWGTLEPDEISRQVSRLRTENIGSDIVLF